MARFIFSLEAVLTQRRHVEQGRQRDLAVVQAQMTALQNELKVMNDSVTSATNDLRQYHLTGKLDMNYLAAHRRFTNAVQRQAMSLVQKIALVQRQVEEAQQALAEAAKRRKAIEKLREKHHERWRSELARKEMAELDEIGMRLAYRANASVAG